MALDHTATLVVGSGNFLTADAGTALPADLKAPETAWENIGHTSIDDIFSQTSEGGEQTVLGTLQNRSLRTSYSTRTESFAITLQQFDAAGLKLYYGSNVITTEDGLIAPAQNPVPTEKAFLAVFIDGENVFAFYAPRAEIFRADDLEIADTESLAGLPLSITPLNYQTNTWTYAVTPLGTTEPAA